jgi:AraC-like DNA-binding protein
MTTHVTDAVTSVRFRSDNLDEMRAHVTPRYGNHVRVAHGRGPYEYAEDGVQSDRVLIGRGLRTFCQTLRAAVIHPTLFLNLQPGESMRYGRRQYHLEPNTAAIAAPGHEYTRHGGPSQGLALRVDTGLLETEIAARALGRSRRWNLQPKPISLSEQRRAELLGFEKTLRAAVQPGSPWGAYGQAETFERSVAGWMAELLLDAAAVRSSTHDTSLRLIRLQQWVDAHLAEDLSLQRLCGVTGMSARSLQKAMLAARAQTPVEFVNSRRLAAANRLLDRASPRLQVAAVALDCGFRHLGRFAAHYRTVYGELPSDTLNRRVGSSA